MSETQYNYEMEAEVCKGNGHPEWKLLFDYYTAVVKTK